MRLEDDQSHYFKAAGFVFGKVAASWFAAGPDFAPMAPLEAFQQLIAPAVWHGGNETESSAPNPL